MADNVASFKRKYDVGMMIKHESSTAIALYSRHASTRTYILSVQVRRPIDTFRRFSPCLCMYIYISVYVIRTEYNNIIFLSGGHLVCM